MLDYFATNKRILLSLVSWLTLLACTIFYNHLTLKTYLGFVEFDDGSRSYTNLAISKSGSFQLDTYFETMGGSYHTANCAGNVEFHQGELILHIDNMYESCLNTYEIARVHDDCFVISNKHLPSKRQTFFVCPKPIS